MQHSKEYLNFIRRLDATGSEKLDGYNLNLFTLIYPEERNEVERLIIEKYNENSDSEILELFPYLQNYDGIALLKEIYNSLEHPCHKGMVVGYLLYETTGEIQYLETLGQDIRMLNYKYEYIGRLTNLTPGKEVYRLFRELYIECPEGLAVSQSIKGLLYNLGYIKDINSYSYSSDVKQMMKILRTAEKSERESTLEKIEQATVQELDKQDKEIK